MTKEETRCRHYMEYSFRLAARIILHARPRRQDSTYHSRCCNSCRGHNKRSLLEFIAIHEVGLLPAEMFLLESTVSQSRGARCSSVVRAFAHGAMGRRIDPSWGGPIELFLVPAIAPRLV